MVYNKPKYQDIVLEHTVEFPEDDLTFGAGREKTTGKTRLFLIFNHTGRIYTRNGRADSWEVVGEADALVIRNLATDPQIPRYTATGSPEIYLQ